MKLALQLCSFVGIHICAIDLPTGYFDLLVSPQRRCRPGVNLISISKDVVVGSLSAIAATLLLAHALRKLEW
jgi:hypothetical protein